MQPHRSALVEVTLQISKDSSSGDIYTGLESLSLGLRSQELTTQVWSWGGAILAALASSASQLHPSLTFN